MQDKQSTAGSSTKTQDLVLGLWGVRYQVKDVQRSIAFYTQTLGFNLDQQNLPAFAQVSIDNLKLILSGPGASGSRPMPDGRQQEPGGWKPVLGADRYRWKILTAIPLSCSSLHGLLLYNAVLSSRPKITKRQLVKGSFLSVLWH